MAAKEGGPVVVEARLAQHVQLEAPTGSAWHHMHASGTAFSDAVETRPWACRRHMGLMAACVGHTWRPNRHTAHAAQWLKRATVCVFEHDCAGARAAAATR